MCTSFSRRLRPGAAYASARRLPLALWPAGCSLAAPRVPPPDDSMNMAQNQLQDARDAGAADYAPVDLGFAQNKFQQAQAAMAEPQLRRTRPIWLEESRADAELAQAEGATGCGTGPDPQESTRTSACATRATDRRIPSFRRRGAAGSGAPARCPHPMPGLRHHAGFRPCPHPPPGSGGFQTVPDQPASGDILELSAVREASHETLTLIAGQRWCSAAPLACRRAGAQRRHRRQPPQQQPRPAGQRPHAGQLRPGRTGARPRCGQPAGTGPLAASVRTCSIWPSAGSTWPRPLRSCRMPR